MYAQLEIDEIAPSGPSLSPLFGVDFLLAQLSFPLAHLASVME
jgi:hypothetical protein